MVEFFGVEIYVQPQKRGARETKPIDFADGAN